MTRPVDLPMAPSGCALDDRGLGEQLDRYRRLGTTALRLQERELALAVTFSAEVNVELIQETVAVERGCCSFFTLDYDGPARQLSIGVEDPARADALAALASALRDGMRASAR
jgi:hypothetical protein